MTTRAYVPVDPATGYADPATLGSGGAGAGAKVLADNHTFITPAGGAPSGAAGGDLSGTYPNPSVVDDSHAHTGSTVTTTDAPSGANDVIDTAATAGSGTDVARATHGHRLNTYSSAAAAIGTAAAGTSGTAPARGDHVHPTGAGTPSTQAFGDAAAVGTGPTAAMSDHKHAMPAAPTGVAVGATYQAVQRTSGSITMTNSQTTMKELSSALRLTIAAAVNDVLEIQFSAIVSNASTGEIAIDSATIISGAIQSQITGGTRGIGHGYWGTSSFAGAITGTIRYVVVSGDISGGNVTVSPTYINSNASGTNSVLATTTYALRYSVINLGH